MVIAMFALSEKAYLLMQELKQKWTEAQPGDQVFDFVKCSALSERSVKKSISELTGEWFEKADALIYLSAAGIAVRSIAPYLAHKSTDPAVLVIDETGKFCISLLSGHAGGANALAGELAKLLKKRGAIPVITTATDREGKFSADDFARKNRLLLKDWDLAKKISAEIVRGEKIGFYSDLDVYGELPKELQPLPDEMQDMPDEMRDIPKAEKVRPRLGVWISFREGKKPYEETLRLIPRSLVVGIGCRKETEEGKIAKAIRQCFKEEGLLTDGIAALASIDLKKRETGILTCCEKNNLPFLVYSNKELMQVEGSFTPSQFVAGITGADNVCERSAVLGAMQMIEKDGTRPPDGVGKDKESPERKRQQAVRLLVRKKRYDGVTVAVAEMIKEIEV